MNKTDVIAYFDCRAAHWDDNLVRVEPVIARILDQGGIREGVHVLDVACGTGVLFPDYLERQVASLTAIDISPEMVSAARRKFPGVKVICGDVETTDFGRKFDAVMVYNAFPHFPDPEKLIRVLSGLLAPGGRLTVAHGMSREQMDRHHQGAASTVSIRLLHEDDLAAIMARCGLQVDGKISDDRMYLVSGFPAE